MQSKAKTVKQYLAELPEDRREAISAVRDVILKNLPRGYAAASLRLPGVAEEPHGALPHVHLQRPGARGVVPAGVGAFADSTAANGVQYTYCVSAIDSTGERLGAENMAIAARNNGNPLGDFTSDFIVGVDDLALFINSYAIDSIDAESDTVQRLMVLGLVEGAELEFLRASLGGDPLEFSLFGGAISLPFTFVIYRHHVIGRGSRTSAGGFRAAVLVCFVGLVLLEIVQFVAWGYAFDPYDLAASAAGALVALALGRWAV